MTAPARPWCVGLTGGVASGKSAVADAFAARGITIADADLAARAAVAPGSDGLAAVVEAFGPGVLTPTGELDRAAMRRRIFDDPAARCTLEAIVHPRVRTLLAAECAAAPSPYVIVAIPLLAEVGREAYPWLQRVLVVDVATAVQHARLVRRDGIDDALATRMIDAQASRAQRLTVADDVLVNERDLTSLQAEVARLDAMYRRLAATA